MGDVKPFGKFTKTKRTAYLESLAMGTAKRRAAAAAGIGYTTVFEYRKANPDFELEEQAAQEQAIGTVENAAFKLAQTNTTAMIFWLKNRAPDRWTDVYDDVLRDRLKAEAKEEFAAVLTEAFTDEGVDAAVIERIATKLRSAARKKSA